MTAMKLRAPLAPQVQQAVALGRLAGEQGRQPGRVGLGRVEAVLFDVLDDAGGLLAADLEEIGHLATADAPFQAQAFEPRAEAVRLRFRLPALVARPELLQLLYLLLIAAQGVGGAGDLGPGRHFQIAQPPRRRRLQPHVQQVALGAAAAGAQHPEFRQRLRVAAFEKPLPFRGMPERLGRRRVHADGLAHPAQKRHWQGEVAAPVLPQGRRADAHLAGQLARRTSLQLQPVDELFERGRRPGVQHRQALEFFFIDLLPAAKGQKALQAAARGRVHAQFNVAQGAAADTRLAGKLQPGHAERFRAQLDQGPGQSGCMDRAGQRTFAQVRVPQRMPGQRTGVVVGIERHGFLSINRRRASLFPQGRT